MNERTPPPPCRYPLPDLEELPSDIRERIEAVGARSGFVPNVFLALARRPAEFRAFFAYHDALMDRDEGLTKAEREMVVVATSAVNDCAYCVVAHGAILRVRAKDPLLADRVAVNWRHASLSPREQAILRLASKVAERPGAVVEEDLQEALGAGLSEEEVWDVVAITAFFALSNRLASPFRIQPNPEFFTLGR